MNSIKKNNYSQILILVSICDIAMIRICKIYIGNPEIYAKHWRLSWFSYETFIIFFKFRFSTRGERDTIFTMLTVPSDPTTRGPTQVQKSTRFVYVQISTHCFYSESLRIPSHRFRAWRHSHPQSNFLSGVFIVTSVIVTSSRTRVNTCVRVLHLPMH